VATVEVLDIPERGVRLEVIVEGTGADVVLVPSARRGATDFEQLSRDLWQAGFGSIAINPRSIGASTGPLDDVSLRDLADDVADTVRRLVGRPAHLIGHAFGNTTVRAAASYHPDVARTVTLLACGGHDYSDEPASDELIRHFERCSRTDLPDADRIESLRYVFFAPANDPSSWLDGWWPDRLGLDSILRSAPGDWWQGGDVPILVIQPLDDALGPPKVGRDLSARLGSRCTYIELANCGHAILPEQPDSVAEHVIRFLRQHSRS
jgi:pimeloyl-ACP methyl ester carboxylesterase